MTNQATTQLPTRAHAEEAIAYLQNEVFAPAFLTKLAAHGIQPRNETEAAQLMQLGATLEERVGQPGVKEAAERNGFLDEAIASLRKEASAEDSDAHVRNAVATALQHDELLAKAAAVFNHVNNGGELQAEPAAE